MKRFIHNFVLLTIVGTAVVLPHSVFGAADSGFVLLTGNDGPLARGTEATSLPGFLNNVYTIMIGAAVVLAILQIIRGGITWMLTDSVYEKGQARHLITIAIMGLVLILSPVIVFNVINPKILNLDITESLSGLSRGLPKPSTEETPDPIGSLPQPQPNECNDTHQTIQGHAVTRALCGSEEAMNNWIASRQSSGEVAYEAENACKKWGPGTDGEQVCVEYLALSSKVVTMHAFGAIIDHSIFDGFVLYLFYGENQSFKQNCGTDSGQLYARPVVRGSTSKGQRISLDAGPEIDLENDLKSKGASIREIDDGGACVSQQGAGQNLNGHAGLCVDIGNIYCRVAG